MIMLGDFDDGEFCSYGFEPIGGEGIVAFDGHHWHSSKCFGLSQKKEPVEGKRPWRLSCVAFTSGAFGTTTPDEKLKLEGAGYRLPKTENPAYPRTDLERSTDIVQVCWEKGTARSHVS